MFKHNILFLIIVCLFAACKGETIDVSKLVAERDSLKEVSASNKSELDNMNFFIDELSQTLDSISIQEGYVVSGKNAEGRTMSRMEMKQSLHELSDLLARRLQRINALQDSLKASSVDKTAPLQSIITNLKAQLEAKERTIAELQAELANSKQDISVLQGKVAALNNDVAQLSEKNEAQKEALKYQTEIINTGYIKIASRKELKNLGIIESTKTRRMKLNSNAFTPSRFTSIDITTFTEVTINSRRPKIITTMPASSYTITENGNGTSTLRITDPTKFWSSSNYLVITTD